MEKQEHYIVAHGQGIRIGVHWNEGVRLWQLEPDVCQHDFRPLLWSLRDELVQWLKDQPENRHDAAVVSWLRAKGFIPEDKPHASD